MADGGTDFAWSQYDVAHWKEQVREARRCPNAFIEYVGDGTGKTITQEAAHREWQDQITREDYLVLLGPVGTGKSTQVRGRLLYEIGREPDTTAIGYISQSEGLPKKQSMAIRQMIETSERVRHVFPHLRPGGLWQSTQFSVARSTTPPEPTLQVFGAYGKILGSRKTWIVLDDICGYVNTLTKASRDKLYNWLAEVFSRLKDGGGGVKAIALGHIWDPDDALQRLAKPTSAGGMGWAYIRYAALHEDDDGEVKATFPNVLPLAEVKTLSDKLGPIFGPMMLLNEMPDSATSRFPRQWFVRAFEQGRGTWYWTIGKPYPCEVVTGVDLGHKKKSGSDLTVMVTVALETSPEGPKRRVIDVRHGRWSGPEIVRQLKELRSMFQTTAFVEDNGGQEYIVNFAEDDAELPVPVYGETTTATGSKAKYDLLNGVEGAIGGELKVGMWILPNDNDMVAPEGVLAMVAGAHSYDPKNAEHTSDFLMAWWLAWKGANHMRPRFGGAPPIDIRRR